VEESVRILLPEHLAGAPKQRCLACNVSGLQETVAVQNVTLNFFFLWVATSLLFILNLSPGVQKSERRQTLTPSPKGTPVLKWWPHVNLV